MRCPTGVASTGTSQASASSAARPNPSRSDGTTTALAALTQSGTRSGSTSPQRQQLDVAGQRLGAGRSASRGAPGRPGTAGSGRPGQARARRGRRHGGSARSGPCRRRTAAPAMSCLDGPARDRPRERLRDASRRGRTRAAPASVIARERGWRQVGAVQRHRACRAPAAPARARPSARSARGRCRTSAAAKPRRSCARRARVRGRLPPGANANSSSSTSAILRSASTWSRTKLPSAGRSALGYMFVTTSARIARERSAVPRLLARSSTWTSAHTHPVAVFDSGVGGLTVLHELLVSLPTEDYVYLGDTARFPYGDRSARRAAAFAIEIAEHLLAARREAARRRLQRRQLGGADALEQHLARTGARRRRDRRRRARPPSWRSRAARNGRIGLLATPATVASGAYERAVRAADPHVHLESVACPDLAPIIQGGLPVRPAASSRRSAATARRCARPSVDTVILGCTHYPLVAPMLQRMLGRGVTLVTSGAGVARSVERALRRARAAEPARGEGDYRFQCTGDVDVVPGSSARAFCRCRSARSCTSSCRRRGRLHDRVAASGSYGRAAGRAAAGRRSSPGSCAPRPARR